MNGEVFVIPTITGSISAEGALSGSLAQEQSLKGTVSQQIEHDTYYDGPYEITPRVLGQTMATADKVMRTDVVIKDIPYSETTNPGGGTTVVIAYEE